MEGLFQIDSKEIKSTRLNDANFIIEINETAEHKDLCVIYFSSHNIYYPNTPEAYQRSILVRDFYEWRNASPISAYKQIFIRDVYKQWYLHGINDRCNSPERLLSLLATETQGFRVITVGSSAGGYAAVLYGCQLNAEKIFAFNAQFELLSLLKNTSPDINPLIFREQNTSLRNYMDIVPFFNKTSKIYYFVSEKSAWDHSQLEHIEKIKEVIIYGFNSSHHGIPFPKVALSTLLNLSDIQLDKLRGMKLNPFLFSARVCGFIKTIGGLAKQVIKKLFECVMI